jgi:hypothetical protein
LRPAMHFPSAFESAENDGGGSVLFFAEACQRH